MKNIVLETYRGFQLLDEDQSIFGSGYTFGEKVFYTIGAHGKENSIDKTQLIELLEIPGVSIFQWLPDWADGFNGTQPYSNIPKELAQTLTKTERLIYVILTRNKESGAHKDLIITFALGRKPTDSTRRKLVYHMCNLRKKLKTEGIRCKRGHYQIYEKS